MGYLDECYCFRIVSIPEGKPPPPLCIRRGLVHASHRNHRPHANARISCIDKYKSYTDQQSDDGLLITSCCTVVTIQFHPNHSSCHCLKRKFEGFFIDLKRSIEQSKQVLSCMKFQLLSLLLLCLSISFWERVFELS